MSHAMAGPATPGRTDEPRYILMHPNDNVAIGHALRAIRRGSWVEA